MYRSNDEIARRVYRALKTPTDNNPRTDPILAFHFKAKQDYIMLRCNKTPEISIKGKDQTAGEVKFFAYSDFSEFSESDVLLKLKDEITLVELYRKGAIDSQSFASWDEFDSALPPEHQGSKFACVDPDGVGPRLFFQRVPEGKTVKNRVHLDVRVATGLVGDERLAALEAECTRLVALGAVQVRLLPADDINESCIIMQDVEGNEFCLD